MRDDEEDVPIRVDFRDPATARTWIEETKIKRPFLPNFFAAFCAALSSRRQIRILELGSGPGHLAREMLLAATSAPTSRSIGRRRCMTSPRSTSATWLVA